MMKNNDELQPNQPSNFLLYTAPSGKIKVEIYENTSPYFYIVSVLMLREGWDVRNVTTIVPLRPYSSKANILPEQTLERGLRRITPPGQACELVTVVSELTGLIIDNIRAEAGKYKKLPLAQKDIDKIEYKAKVSYHGAVL